MTHQDDTAATVSEGDGVRSRRQCDPVVARLIESNSVKTVTLSRDATVDSIIRQAVVYNYEWAFECLS